MNAAAREINQSSIFQGQWTDMHFSLPVCFRIGLLLAVFISALAIVYVTNVQRVTISQLEQAQRETHELELQRGQLLLERASLSRSSRVEEWARDNLHMTLPSNQQTFILRAQ